jgi:hypothetical protein
VKAERAQQPTVRITRTTPTELNRPKIITAARITMLAITIDATNVNFDDGRSGCGSNILT